MTQMSRIARDSPSHWRNSCSPIWRDSAPHSPERLAARRAKYEGSRHNTKRKHAYAHAGSRQRVPARRLCTEQVDLAEDPKHPRLEDQHGHAGRADRLRVQPTCCPLDFRRTPRARARASRVTQPAGVTTIGQVHRSYLACTRISEFESLRCCFPCGANPSSLARKGSCPGEWCKSGAAVVTSGGARSISLPTEASCADFRQHHTEQGLALSSTERSPTYSATQSNLNCLS